MTDHRAEAEQLLADYRRSRDQLAAVYRALATLTVSQTSDDGAVTVTVGAQGVLTGLDLRDEALRRYRPQALADTVVRLVQAAAARAAEEAAGLVEPVLPPGVDAAALLAGRGDLRPEEIAPAPEPAPAPDPEDEGFSWMQPAHGGGRR